MTRAVVVGGTTSTLIAETIDVDVNGPVVEITRRGPGPSTVCYRYESPAAPPAPRLFPRDNGHPKRWRP